MDIRLRFTLIAMHNKIIFSVSAESSLQMKNGSEIVIHGCSSYCFGRNVICSAASSPVLREDTSVPVDPDADRLWKMAVLAEHVSAECGGALKIEAATGRKERPKNMDFAVLPPPLRNAYFHSVDTHLPMKYGIARCSSVDTIGSGGIFRVLYEIPALLRGAEDARKQAGRITPPAWFLKNRRPDYPTGVIESMWGNLKKEFFINGPNQGAVTNLPDDAFLELRRTIDMNGFQALPYGNMPRGILGLTHQVLDAHELTVEAALSCDRKILLRALCTDPLVNNIGDARNIMNELLEAERSHLPPHWFS